MKYLLFAALLFSVSCGRQPQIVAAAETPVVPVVKAARADLVNDIKLTAEFEPFQEIDVMAKIAGYVSNIRVDIGDRVAEGALLATLEVPEMKNDLARADATVQAADADVASARDELRRAESARDFARLSFDRITQVSNREKGLVPQQQLDDLQSRDLMADAQVAAARSQLNALEQRSAVARAEQARVKTMFEYTNITAPFAGVVTKRYANKGAMIQAGISSQSQAMPVVRLAEDKVLRLVLPVPESAVSHIRPGSTVDVVVPSLHRTFPGRVARSAQTVTMSTRTMDTQVDVQNTAFQLVPGMYAEVNLRLDEHDHALTVPIDSVDNSGNGARLFIVRDGRLHSAPVSTGMESAARIEIRSGIGDGDLVVVGRQSGLKDGEAVQAKPIDYAGH